MSSGAGTPVVDDPDMPKAFQDILGNIPFKVGNFGHDSTLQLSATHIEAITEQIEAHPATSFKDDGVDQHGQIHTLAPLLDISTNIPILGDAVEKIAEHLLGETERREQRRFSESIGEHLQTDKRVAAQQKVNNAAVFSTMYVAINSRALVHRCSLMLF
eukprot:COSAG01_NODE_9271_length_2496_cov_5.806842_3_plen_159_part_00